MPDGYIEVNCYMIDEKEITNNPDLKGDYNVPRYVTAFNKRIEPLLVVFSPEIRDEILIENRSILDALVEELLEKETLQKEEIAAIFKHVASRPKRPAWTGSASRIPSRIPPVAIKARVSSKSEEGVKRKKKPPSKEA